MNIPEHVAIILDGNGRWAKSKGMPRTYGHTQGAKNVENICRIAWNKGIKYLTVYAFSTEKVFTCSSLFVYRMLMDFLFSWGRNFSGFPGIPDFPGYASVKSSCRFSMLARATLMVMGSPSWNL